MTDERMGFVEKLFAEHRRALQTHLYRHIRTKSARRPMPAALAQHVTAGYQARIDGGVMSAQPVPVDLRQVLGWLQRKIVFEHRPLGDVTA